MLYQSYNNPVASAAQPGWWFVFHKDKLLVKISDDEVQIPFVSAPGELNLDPKRLLHVGQLGDDPCFSTRLDSENSVPDGYAFQGMRTLFSRLDDMSYGIAARAMQLVQWDMDHLYCSRCGQPAAERNEEGAQTCRSCGYVNFPRISPAIIVAVIKDNRILLAHSGRFINNMYSVLAGYVEMGESLEECVKREVEEETGIEVKNIRYFGSQYWAYSGALMVGFSAEYESGEIRLDDAEIDDAGWFPADDLPMLPGKLSIARELIDWFVDNNLNKEQPS